MEFFCDAFIFYLFLLRALTNTPENLPFCIVQFRVGRGQKKFLDSPKRSYFYHWKRQFRVGRGQKRFSRYRLGSVEVFLYYLFV